jgi:hypothetical protein
VTSAVVWISLLATVLACQSSSDYEPQDGDIVFQTSLSAQSRAIQLATGSPYSHMGIVVVAGGAPHVLEAVGPVKRTPLAEWVARGKDGAFVVKRLRRARELLTPTALRSMRDVGAGFVGRDYDTGFAWSDDRLYCSELVWKIYNGALGLEIGTLQRLGDFDLGDPVVRNAVHERWGDAPPLEMQVISPAAMFASDLLVEVHAE